MRVIFLLIVCVTFSTPIYGDNAVPFVSSAFNESNPSWSPDGARIAYECDALGTDDIYTIPATGGSPTLIFTSSSSNGTPEWSPDSSTIVFFRVSGSELWKVPSTGGTASRFTFNSYFDQSPSWSSDDAKIAFHGYYDKASSGMKQLDYKVFWIPADDGTAQPIPISTYMDNLYPDWEPFSSYKLALSNNAWAGYYDIIWLDLGMGGDRITTAEADDIHPAYSPYGKYVAFASDRSGNWDIWVIPSTGGTAIQLTDDPATDWAPSWSPDGDKIVFTTRRNGNYDLYLIDVSSIVNIESASLGEIKAHYATDEMKGK